MAWRPKTSARRVALGLFLLILCGRAVRSDAANGDPTGLAFFESRVRPILVQHCASCHSANAAKLRGGLRLDTRTGWEKGGDSGPAIERGDPEKSLLIRAVRYEDENLRMPPKGKLAESDITALERWVKIGAPDPRDGSPVVASSGSIDLEAGRAHWAFQPLRQASQPAVNDDSWCRNPIDRFILARLDAESITPSPPADRRTLIRRMTLDLTGLPPTLEELDRFLRDPDPQAVERLIDRLLASPQHGERWARHWLDLARFAESHGFEHDTDRPTAYPYRDFVVRALNDDLPFDRFATWQLAGDELEPNNPLALAATGFLAAGVHSTQITANQVEKERYDELDDMLGTTGTAFLGLTIGCARCHDHKYDPILQRDYYGLLASFTTTVRTEIDLPAGRDAKAALSVKSGAIKALICSEGLPPQRLNSQGPDFFDRIHFLQRGDPNRKQGIVTQAFPGVLCNGPETDGRWHQAPPAGWRTSYRRRSLAAWLTDVDQGAGMLLARVIVNRLWQHHFGRGLVATPSDFGRQGSPPSHPELLDWLAAELIRGGWRLKPIHRMIVTSATYRQASTDSLIQRRRDPENRWLGRYSRRRLEAEAIRDSILAVSGRLDRRMYGPGTLDEDQTRRSLYFTVKRSRLIPMMVLFDAPDALQGLAVRSSTTVAPQSLWLMNSPVIRRAAADLAQRVGSTSPSVAALTSAGHHEALIVQAYKMALGREPSREEREAGAAFVAGSEVGPEQAFADFCQVVLSLSEFLDLR